MNKTKAKRAFLKEQQLYAPEMYKILNDFRRAIFVNGGQPDDIMKCAQRALAVIRKIDNPNIISIKDKQ